MSLSIHFIACTAHFHGLMLIKMHETVHRSGSQIWVSRESFHKFLETHYQLHKKNPNLAASIVRSTL